MATVLFVVCFLIFQTNGKRVTLHCFYWGSVFEIAEHVYLLCSPRIHLEPPHILVTENLVGCLKALWLSIARQFGSHLEA